MYKSVGLKPFINEDSITLGLSLGLVIRGSNGFQPKIIFSFQRYFKLEPYVFYLMLSIYSFNSSIVSSYSNASFTL